ncbi:MAG: peptide methionine sulfoxide reductase MsrB [Gemmatales bacterium]|nr:MAG: peptide methionine sulfoxide reductase MsrB [Gemmatales bacterium]
MSKYVIFLGIGLGLAALAAYGVDQRVSVPKKKGAKVIEKIKKTDEEWRKILTEEQYRVTRQHGTEPAFRNEYWNNKKDGIYRCVCCGLELFDSRAKYDSGTGWPSFWEPFDQAHIGTTTDRSFGMIRTEVHCIRCDAHLGHVFDDGPRDKTGLRYCINSAALKFEPREKK